MKRFIWLVIMLLVAGCGGGGGSSPGNSSTPSGTSGTTGAISVQFVKAAKSALYKSVALDLSTVPGRARIVLYSASLNYKKVVDVASGSTLEPIALPVATDYQVQAVFYAKGTPNELSSYGTTTNTVSVAANGTTVVVLSMADIAMTMATPVEVYSGAAFDVAEPPSSLLDACGLQSAWSLSFSASPFSSRLHLAHSPLTSHTGNTAPVVSTSGSLYFQGEFFIKSDLLDSGESVYDWSFVTQPATTTALKLVPMDFPVGLPSDTRAPEVRSFTVPTTKLATTVIAPISIVAVDNAEIAGYKITESATPPSAGSDGWSAAMPTSYTYTGALNRGFDNIVNLYVWVKDPTGNVSAFVDGVTNKTVVLNCSPVVTSFTVPSAPQFTPADIAVAISGISYSPTPGSTLQYLVTESSQTPSVSAAWQSSATASYSGTYTITGITPAIGASYNVSLYAWVKDDVGISQYARSVVTISDAPQVTGFSVGSVASGTTVDVLGLTGQPYPGRSIAGYLVTASPFKPLASSFQASVPATYNYPGLTPGVATTKYIYGYVLDSAGVVSLAKQTTVHFSAP